jgi:SAM-dependent methyltransferase
MHIPYTPHIYHAQTFSLNPPPFLEPLTRHVPAPAPHPVLVLDVGCGSGRDLGFEVMEAFTNASALDSGERWLRYVVGNAGRASHQKTRPEPSSHAAQVQVIAETIPRLQTDPGLLKHLGFMRAT